MAGAAVAPWRNGCCPSAAATTASVSFHLLTLILHSSSACDHHGSSCSALKLSHFPPHVNMDVSGRRMIRSVQTFNFLWWFLLHCAQCIPEARLCAAENYSKTRYNRSPAFHLESRKHISPNKKRPQAKKSCVTECIGQP